MAGWLMAELLGSWIVDGSLVLGLDWMCGVDESGASYRENGSIIVTKRDCPRAELLLGFFACALRSLRDGEFAHKPQQVPTCSREIVTPYSKLDCKNRRSQKKIRC